MTNEYDPASDELKRRLADAETALRAAREGQAAAEAREDHIKQVLLAIRNVNQLIVRERDLRQLIDRACDTLIETLGFHNAWIALLDDAGKVTMTASSGFDGGFKAMQDQLGKGAFPACMRHALAQDHAVVIKDPVIGCADCSLSAEYAGRAGMTHRLSHKGRIYGILSVSVPSAYAFDPEEQALFDELAEDMGFAIHKIEAEEEVRRLTHIVRAIPHPMSLVSRDYRYLAGNDVYAALYEIPRETIVGRRVVDFFGQTVFDGEIRPHLDRCLAGETVRYESQLKFPDNNLRWMAMEYLPYRDERGDIVAVISHGIDITERKGAEKRLEQTLYATTGGIWYWHFPTNTLTFGPRYYTMLGYEPDEFPSTFKNWLDLIHPEDRPSALSTAREYLETKPDLYENDFRLRKKDGTYLCIHSRARVVERSPEGEPVLMIGNHEDVTQRKLAEEEKERLEEQFRQAQKLESVGRLAGGVAHDFNNMLGVIIANAESAKMDMRPEQPIYKNIQEILNASHRAAETVRQLLAFARKQTISPRILDLDDMVSGALKMLRRLIGEDIALQWVPGKAVGRVRMDPTQIHQILANLVVNSRDAMPNGGTISIETANKVLDESYAGSHNGFVAGDYVVLTVSDTGVGMSADVLEQVFDPFFTTKEVGKGTGLGLPMVYGSVKQNDGFIDIYSEPGEGTTVKIYLPRCKEEPAALEKIVETKAPEGKETVLVTEDERALLLVCKTAIERQGYTVLAAASPEQALALAEKHAGEIQLLVTDVVMPGMNGRELWERLKESRPSIRCLFMSGYNVTVVADHGVLDKGVNFIEKPFSFRELTEKVRSVLDG